MRRLTRGWIQMAALLVTLLLVAAACGGDEEPTAEPGGDTATEDTGAGDEGDDGATDDAGQEAGDGEPLDIAFMAGIVGIPFYTSMECGARDAAADLGVDLNWQGPPEWDIAQQMPLIEAALQTDPDGIVLAPTDPVALVPTVEQLMDGGTPVVTVDGSLEDPVEIQNMRTNNPEAGAAAADALGEAIGGQGEVLIIALDPGVLANTERATGFIERMEEAYPDVELLPTEYPGSDENRAAQITQAAIQANPDLAGIYTTHSSAAQGAAAAVLESGRQGELRVVAYDADPQQVSDLRDGLYDALVVQTPYRQGYDSVQLVHDILTGEVDQASVENQAYSDVVIATRDNIDDPEVERYLYVTSC